MKRSLILFLLFVVSSTQVLASSVNMNYTELHELKNYQIVIGDPDGELRYDDFITRAEVTAIICRLIHIETIEQSENFFYDVPEGHWSIPYINAAYQHNIIHGYDDGTFRPDANITYSEVYKMIVSALKYNFFAETSGGYPKGYIEVIINNLELVEEKPENYLSDITRGEVFELIYNALDIPIVEYISKDDFVILNGVYDGAPLRTLRMFHELKFNAINVQLDSNSTKQLIQWDVEKNKGFWQISICNTSNNRIAMRIVDKSDNSQVGSLLFVYAGRTETFVCDEPLDEGTYFLEVSVSNDEKLDGILKYNFMANYN